MKTAEKTAGGIPVRTVIVLITAESSGKSISDRKSGFPAGSAPYETTAASYLSISPIITV